MTEEEMMALALRLSEQEASVAALKLQQEEDAVMKAIEESVSTDEIFLAPQEMVMVVVDQLQWNYKWRAHFVEQQDYNFS